MEQIKNSIMKITEKKVSIVNFSSSKQILKFISMMKNDLLEKDIIYIFERNELTHKEFKFANEDYICLFNEKGNVFSKVSRQYFKYLVENTHSECPICQLELYSRKLTLKCNTCFNSICAECFKKMVDVSYDGDDDMDLFCPMCRTAFEKV